MEQKFVVKINMEIISPFFVVKPWAGDYLSDLYQSQMKSIGEAWLISTLDQAETKIGMQDLSAYLGKKLSFLVKIIDAKESLSIQVHPNDQWAKKLENSKGKTECWLIIHATAGAGVYLGLKEGVSDQDFKNAIFHHESVEHLMNFYTVSNGDFITVPAGTLHAIGAGVTLLEVQQASGITYRLWDWGRTGRELHIEKGLKVCDFRAPYQITKAKSGLLFKHSDFSCYINESHGMGWFVNMKNFEVSLSDQPQSENYIFIV